ncbi:phosphonate C-P lyase system protein PhnH [Prauserella cavernicola]|uniref:Phosphonate C-P lyase system protein PhnH n=1 Tax=Prauserella cavernicola TaxID=2800127 RepID=A0A934QNE8_9PSEU|nr:phosphonate C-P lyase system protein PhnH [Prauserella cavernicola]MBK1783018.1 phosphonate C-P lyase system protein PhnH [Prauserella cavernicola]
MNTTAELIRTASLRPDDAQHAFRAVLDALARPGRITRLPQGPLGTVPAALVPVLALADLGTGVHVLADDPLWADITGVATNAPSAPLDEARLVAALRPITGTELASLCRGSAPAPENAALAALAVPRLTGGEQLHLTGPGIRDRTVLAPAGLPAGFVTARGHGDFPAGIDLLLVAPDGSLAGLPRTTRLTDTTADTAGKEN